MRVELSGASVVLVGAGNIGSHVAPLLGRAGIGTVAIIDRDIVEAKNLKQQDFLPEDVGQPKAQTLARRLARSVPSVRVQAYDADLKDVPASVFQGHLLLGALDSRRARQILICERAWPLGVPVIDGGVGEGLVGRVQTFVPGNDTACLECGWGDKDYRALAQEYPCVPGASPHAPATQSPACVGATVAALMVAQTLKILSGEAPQESREIAFDLMHHRFLEARLKRHPRCRFDHRRAMVRTLPPTSRIADLLALGAQMMPGAYQVESPRFATGAGFATGGFVTPEGLLPRANEPLSTLTLQKGDGVRLRSSESLAIVFVE